MSGLYTRKPIVDSAEAAAKVVLAGQPRPENPYLPGSEPAHVWEAKLDELLLAGDAEALV